MSQNNQLQTLCCPLCGSEEYLLSEKNSMLCAECGSFFEDVDQIVTAMPQIQFAMRSKGRMEVLRAFH